MDSQDDRSDEVNADWPERTLLLAGTGIVIGLLVNTLLPGSILSGRDDPGSVATAMGFSIGFVLFAFTIERRLWPAALIFSAGTGLVGGLILYWSGTPGGWSAGEGWRWVSLLLAIGISAPLFQAARDTGRIGFPYASVHDHAWSNVVLWVACCVFVGLVFAMLWLLAALFQLIGIRFLEEMLREDWVIHALIGGAFGAAAGLLREHERVVQLLQRVVAMVLAVLTPALAFGLVLFILALPFTGLQALWDATRNTTPILLACIIGALILVNAVIGNGPAEARRSPALRVGAMALAAVILPLAVLAAVATGLRIGQYGFTPDRLWAAVFVGLACLYGVAYLGALAWRRGDWASSARPANLVVAMIVCGVAVLLATPLISFNAISVRDQVGRLESGRVTPDKFDWRALAFDLGPPGRTALQRLQRSADATIRRNAQEVAKAEEPYELNQRQMERERGGEIVRNTRVLPRGAAMPPALRNAIARDHECTPDKCTLFVASAVEALLFLDRCFDPPVETGKTKVITYGCNNLRRYLLKNGQWAQTARSDTSIADPAAAASGYAGAAIEIRTVPRRQAFIGGVPVGEPFE